MHKFGKQNPKGPTKTAQIGQPYCYHRHRSPSLEETVHSNDFSLLVADSLIRMEFHSKSFHPGWRMQVCILFTVALTLLSPDLAAHRAPNLGTLLVVLLIHCCIVLVASSIALRTNSRTRSCTHRSCGLAAQLHMIVWSVGSVGSVIFFATLSPGVLEATVIPIPTVVGPCFTRLLFVLPCLTSLLLSWAILFEAEKTIGLVGMTESRWKIVLQKSRGFLLLPVTVLATTVFWSDLVSGLIGNSVTTTLAAETLSNALQTDWLLSLVRVLPLPGLLLAFPILLRCLQAPHCLPQSELRERIQDRCEQANFKPMDLLIWNTGQSVRNAAVSGFGGRLRYVLLSDRLLAEIDHDRIERIVLHEVAHAIHAHSVKLLTIAIVLIGSTYAVYSISATNLPWTATALIMTIFASVGVGLYGQLARRFELQADLWAAQESGEAVEYLRAIADVASGHPDRATWLHPSFQSRCEFLLNGFEKAHRSLRSQFRTTVVRLVGWFFVLPLVAYVLSVAWRYW